MNITTYIVHIIDARSQIKVHEVKATGMKEARQKARDLGTIFAGPTVNLELPDKRVRPDQL